MTPSSPALCTERSWSALPTIRYINYDLWLLKALKCSNRCSPVTFPGPQDQLDDRYPRPPWCLTVRVVGHYFLPGQEPPTPCCVLKPPGLVRVRLIIYLSPFLCLYWGVCSGQAPCTLDVFLFPGVSSPRCSVLPYDSHPEPRGPSTYLLPGRRLGTRLGPSRVCRAELRPGPTGVSPNPHCQNHAFRRESQAGLQRQLPAEWEQKHKGEAVNLAEVTDFGLVF